MIFRHSYLFLSLLLFSACVGSRARHIKKDIITLENDFQDHTGFVLFDPEKDKFLVDYQGHQYFTPASNTKILTFYASLNTFPDSLTGIHYVQRKDSLIFWGSGDPSLLYENLPPSHVIDFLREQQDTLYLAEHNFDEDRFGPGWSWDDYNYTYSSERAALPVYGNYFTMKLDSVTGFLSTPQPYFRKFIWLGDTLRRADMVREQYTNKTTFYPDSVRRTVEFRVPFRYSTELTATLLSDTLKKTIIPLHGFDLKNNDYVHSVKSILLDSALREMMQESDNFIAEQMLLMIAAKVSDTLSSKTGIDYVRKKYLENIPDQPRWVDGSGLSRFNLTTPHSVVWLWNRIYHEFAKERILPLLTHGGGRGTLHSYYKMTPPFVYGKTGTLSNNHVLSGFIFTRKGHMYIFSFMNNNYPTYATPVKVRMEQILTRIYETL